MNNTTLTLLATGVIGLSLLIGANVEVLEVNNKNRYLTNAQYTELKADLETKYTAGEVFTYQEYELMIAVLNKEAKKGKFRNLTNIEKGDIIMKLVNEINYEK